MDVKVIEFNADNVKLLPPAPGKCQQCAVDHEPELPHNQQSLHYQYWFYLRNQRWPTWTDAMRHCTPEMRYQFSAGLMERGVIPFEIHRNWGVPKW
jgi:hypothetical protein